MRSRPRCTAAALALGIAACAGEPTPAALPPQARPPEAIEEPPPAAQAQEAAPEPVLINAVEPLPAPDPMPAATIASPRPEEVIPLDRAAAFEVVLEVKDWPAKEGGGHVHVILDNQPFKAVPAPRAALRLGEIAPGATLGEGQHVIVVFAARDDHVSIKPSGRSRPFAVVPFWIGSKGAPSFRPADPALVYSMPEGTYRGPDAEAILLDFYVMNAEIGRGKHTVHATVTPSIGDPRSITITRWQPFRILNLPQGEARVRLDLRDASGVLVPGPWGAVERVIAVERAVPLGH